MDATCAVVRIVASLLLVLTTSLALPPRADAQPSSERSPAQDVSSPAQDAASGPSAADRSAASATYDRASAAFLAQQFERAAELFETAYRIVPNPVALIQGIRARLQNDEFARATTLAARLTTEHGDEEPFATEARDVLAAQAPELLAIQIECEGPCVREIDGTIQDEVDGVVYVTPGEHDVTLDFETGSVSRSVSGAAGETRRVHAAPPEPEPNAEAEEPSIIVAEDASSEGADPALFAVMAGATAVSAGVLIAFGVDTWSGVDDYRRAPDQPKLDAGQERELRTNIMFGVTGALALGTLVVALLTDWDGDAPPVSAAVAGEGLVLTLNGRLSERGFEL